MRQSKRARTEHCAATRAGGECPICFDQFTVHEGKRRITPFARCGHAICEACDTKMFITASDRCPMCRSPRTTESIRSQTSEAIEQHSIAEAQRDRSVHNTVFFPVGNDEGGEVDTVQVTFVSDFQPAAFTDLPSSVNSFVAPADSTLADVLHSLFNPQRVSLRDFRLAVRRLRHTR